MKKIIFLFLLVILSVCSADPTIALGTPKDYDLAYIYFHVANDFNDSNTLVVNTYDDPNTSDSFLGLPQYIIVDATGTDTSYKITLSIDPTELKETQVAKLCPLKTFTLSTATGDVLPYVVDSADQSANVFGGFPIIGKLYISIEDADDATLTDLKVWVFYDKKKAAK